MRNTIAVCFLACVLSLIFSGTCFAHRVNIFAYADGDAIQVECYFSKSQRVRHGRLLFSDKETGQILHEGVSDEHGMFRYRPEQSFLDTGHGLHILLQAGEGHQNSWQVEPEELRALSSAVPPVQKQAENPVLQVSATQEAGAHVPDTVDYSRLEALMDKVLDAKLAPIRQAIARQQDSTPELKDIVGGLGWIVGLWGIAMYLRCRMRQ